MELDPFDILPPGWIVLTHNCGMPVYLHKESRVCTMARPYCLGQASGRTHDIPLSAIPCLQWKKLVDRCDKKNSKTEAEKGLLKGHAGEGEKLPVISEEQGSEINGEVAKVAVISEEQGSEINGEVAKVAVISEEQGSEINGEEGKVVVISEEQGDKTNGEEPLKNIKEHRKDSIISEETVNTIQPSQETVEKDLSDFGAIEKGVCPFKSPQKVWHVSQESFSPDETSNVNSSNLEIRDHVSKKKPEQTWIKTPGGGFKKVDVAQVSDESPMPAVLEFSSTETDMKISEPKSPGGENIAVSLDSSSLLNGKEETQMESQDEKCLDKNIVEDSVVNIEEEKELEKEKEPDLEDGELEDGEITDDDDVNSNKDAKSNVVTNGKNIDTTKTAKSSKSTESLEEGEIVSSKMEGLGGDTNQKHLSRRAQKKLRVAKRNLNIIADTTEPSLSPSKDSASTPGQDENEAGVVVTEEAGGRQEPSELVTSGTNPLLAIKRKLEELKHNKLHNKQRRLDPTSTKASGRGFNTDYNIAVEVVKQTEPCTVGGGSVVKPEDSIVRQDVKVQTAEERAKENILSADDVHVYCKNLFEFKTIEVKRYNSWKERRSHLKNQTRMKKRRPELPNSTKLITCPIIGQGDNKAREGRKDFVLNPTGKSHLGILHEYLQRTLQTKPIYSFVELVNSKTPYGATVSINDIDYGKGYASSKKLAKQEAAKETLRLIMPEVFAKLTETEVKRGAPADLSFFDDIEVTDPRVDDLCKKAGQPGPYNILLECLRRNFGMGSATKLDIKTRALKNQKCEFTITVGKHSAVVLARNKRDGKQVASQAILAKLHPHVPSWGSLLRLYGTNMEKPVEKVEQLNEIKTHTANHKVLASLREEMKKLHQQKEAIQSKGRLTISSKDLPSKMTGLDL